ncbi:MAG: hypothetical protein O2887_01275 [Bacteroidetes bacterium]|nr:hypothetical protein [Bacteroidota bacterium]MDA1119121.1 hypothetical protein [Bacteroidota bacterium]
MRKIYLLIFAFLICANSYAQYNQSAGLRLGLSSGVTFKKFIQDEEAMEMLLTGRNDGLQLTGLYEFHKPLKWGISDRMYLNYGVGGHFGYERDFRERFIYLPNSQVELIDSQKHQFTMGIDALIGIEYRWLAVPLTISIDMKPYFDYVGMRSTHLRFWDTALSVKYIF